MDLKEIEQCLQKYAKELNEKGGWIYLMSEYYYVGAQFIDKGGYSQVTVDGADLVLDKTDFAGGSGQTLRIPYHAIWCIKT